MRVVQVLFRCNCGRESPLEVKQPVVGSMSYRCAVCSLEDDAKQAIFTWTAYVVSTLGQTRATLDEVGDAISKWQDAKAAWPHEQEEEA